MPKLAPVTDAELAELMDSGLDLLQTCVDFERRITSGYVVEPITEPLRKASGLLAASRGLADLAHAVLVKAQLAEQARDIEKTLRARTSEKRK